MPSGRFSEWLFGAPRDGSGVRLFGPLGKATFDPEAAKNLLCVAGGSGIAGMMAILSCADRARYFEHHRGWVFFGVRTFADAFFLGRLSALVSRCAPGLTVTIAFSDEAVPSLAKRLFPTLRFERGYVHDVARAGMSGRYDDVRAYIAGPPAAVEATLRVLLVEGRLPASEIRYDKFT